VNDWPSFALIAARAVHFGACLLIFGVWVFDRFIIVPAAAAQWRSIARWLLALALPLAALSGAWWLGELALDMSGHALDMNIVSLVWKHMDIVSTVWKGTHFGQLWQLRLIYFAVAAFSALLSRWTIFRWIALIASGLLLGSLAWAGHGRTDQWTTAHLLADTVHLLTAGCWPIGLLPFGLMLLRLKRSAASTPSSGTPGEGRGGGDLPIMSQLTARFSAMSLTCVSLLTATGLVNACVLLGTVSNLWQTTYGRVLLVKIAVFTLMVGLGAINLLLLKPRLATGQRRAANWLGLTVTAELVLTIAVIAIVALLGLLPPAI
jgi:putative copper resistance protein D